MRASFVVLLAAAALFAVPSRASAITPDQIVEMTKAGVSEAVILAVIDRDQTIFDLDATQLVALKQQGLSDTIVLAMLKSGRPSADQPPAVQGPEVLIIGHGPDVPDTLYWDRLYWNPTYVIPVVPPYISPYPVRRATAHRQLPKRTAR